VQSHIPFTHTFAFLGCRPDEFLSHSRALGQSWRAEGSVFHPVVSLSPRLAFVHLRSPLSAKRREADLGISESSGRFPGPPAQQITLACLSPGPAPPCSVGAIVLPLDHAEQKRESQKVWVLLEVHVILFFTLLRSELSLLLRLFSLKYTFPKSYDSRETQFPDVHRCFGMHVDSPGLPKAQTPPASLHKAASASSHLALGGTPVAVSQSLLSLQEDFQLRDTAGSGLARSRWTLIPGC